MSPFHRVFAPAFLASAAALLALTHIETRRGPVGKRLAMDLPEGLADARVSSAQESKARRLFWLGHAALGGAAIRLLEDPGLFEEVFPGYRQALGDRDLWKEYFGQIFAQSVHVPRFSAVNPAVTLSTSRSGNLALLRRHGADVVILGSSETHANIVPGLLSTVLPGKKILLATQYAMMPDLTIASAKIIEKSGRRAEFLVWGYSVWNAYWTGAYAAAHRRRLTVHQKNEQGKLAALKRWVLFRLNWNHLVGVNFDERRRPVDAPARPEARTWARTAAGVDLRVNEKGALVSFSEEALSRPGALEAIARAVKPYHANLEGIGEKDCRLDAASAELDEAIEELLKVSRKILIYIPPTPPLHWGGAPPCFVDGVRRMLRSKAGGRVLVETGDWRSYGLTYGDYVAPHGPGAWTIDANHTSYAGAKKVSAKIGDLIVKHW